MGPDPHKGHGGQWSPLGPTLLGAQASPKDEARCSQWWAALLAHPQDPPLQGTTEPGHPSLPGRAHC